MSREEILEKLKEATEFVGGECYQRAGKLICDLFEGIRLTVDKNTLEAKLVEEPHGLQRWDTLKDVAFFTLMKRKNLVLYFDELNPWYAMQAKARGMVYYSERPLETIDEKLEHGVAKKFRAKYLEMVKRAALASAARKAQSYSYSCPKCGSTTIIGSSSGKYRCVECGHEW